MAAIADTANINIPFFKSKSMQIYLNRRGQPYMSVGGFGAVFRFKDAHNLQYALKVFTRDVPGRGERYKILHDTLAITKFSFMVDFQYVADRVRVGSENYPAVIMEWGDGMPLNSAIAADLEDDGILQKAPVLAGNIFELVKTLQEWKMGHGDLQEGNLLIRDDNRVTLIDYDGMYVPGLEGGSATEIGLADYQHPARKQQHFGSDIDDFALASILYQLAMIEPGLWQEHHDDKRLILRQADYEKAAQSALIKKNLKSKVAHVRARAEILADACGATTPLGLGVVERILATPAIVDWFSATEKSSVNAHYTSIIAQVVSLSEDQVNAYESDATVLPETSQPANTTSTVSGSPSGRSATRPDGGTWDLTVNIAGALKNNLLDLFYEEVNESATPAGSRSGSSSIEKIKSGLLNLFFEEVPEAIPEELKPTDPVAAENQAAGATKTNTPPEPENAPGPASPPASKSAPLPDWMKNRRKK